MSKIKSFVYLILLLSSYLEPGHGVFPRVLCMQPPHQHLV